MKKQLPLSVATLAQSPQTPHRTMRAVPLGAALLMGTLSQVALAQQSAHHAVHTLPTVEVSASAESTGKDTLNPAETRIGKGRQQLRDIPQSVTVVTEKLMDERNLETVKEALKNTAGVTFLAAEGGEEDIRLRGFSLQGTGDVFVDGGRDPAFYDRDTFNQDRMEVLRGSASMLFGRGSTGGAVNQVSKVARAMDEHEVSATVGSGTKVRLTGDFNFRTGTDQGLRLNVMADHAKNNGAGTKINKQGIAANYRLGIGQRHEWQFDIYHLNNRNGINYGMPWLTAKFDQPAGAPHPQPSGTPGILPIRANTYYGLKSDYNHGKASWIGAQHTMRFENGGELNTRLRKAWFERDQRPSTIRFKTDRNGANGLPKFVDASTFGPNTILRRGAPLKIQDLETLQFQSDYSGKFKTGSVEHAIQAGLDVSIDEKKTFGARNSKQGGVDLAKPDTTVGTPSDGASINEKSRVLYKNSNYKSTGWGAYVMDTMQVAPQWKLVAGLRYDNLKGTYQQHRLPNDAPAPFTTTEYKMKVSEWSKRLGVLWQPTDRHSFHFSYGTSFNTSGDAYSLGADNKDTPPEKSRNIELGAKIDSPNRQWSLRTALFHSTKYNERNTDPDLPVVTLSGQRHVAGLEFDIAGRITPQWEIYASYMFIPVAKVDKAAPCPAPQPGRRTRCMQGSPGERPGDRPALTPKHSGTIWTTYQVNPQWRLGGGLNFRGAQKPLRVDWKVPSFTTVDLMAEYKPMPNLSLRFNINNVTNKRYADHLYPGHYVPGAERSYYLTASYKF